MGKSSDYSRCAEWEERTTPADASTQRKRQQRERSRLYIFAVTTLAVFLAGLLVRPPAPIGYEWETTIRHTASGDTNSASQLLAADPTAEFASHCEQVAATDADQHDEAPRCGVNVTVTVDANDDSARTIVVRHRHSNKDEGRACLTRTVDRFVAAHNRSDNEAELASRRDEAAANLRFWETRVTTIERELSDFVHFATKRQQGDRSVESGTTAQVVPANQMTNPRWESLSRQFQDADIRLRGLQERFTDAHPHVIEAQRVVAALERILESTPQFIAASHSGAVNTTPLATSNSPGADQVESATNSDVTQSPTYQALNKSLQEAIESRRVAAEELREIPSKGHTVVETAMIEQPVRLAKVLRSPIDRPFLLSHLIPAVVLGVVMTVSYSRTPVSPTLCSPADVEESLDLPVYGTLSTSGEQPLPPPAASPVTRSIQRLVTVCELAIIASVLVIVVCAILHPEFVAEAIQDPLGAVGSVLQRLGVYR